MRTTTAAQLAALDAEDRSTWLRVLVDRGSSDWVDLSAFEGVNWVKSATYQGGEDTNTITASINLRRRHYDLNISPLVDSSKINVAGTVIRLWADIKIEVAVMPGGIAPSSSDWVEAFNGKITKFSMHDKVVVLSCSDQAAVPIAKFIETQQKRPADPSTSAPVEDIMQEILDAEFGASAVVLYSENGTVATPFDPADSPGWQIKEYIQSKRTVFEALRILAEQIGWSIRYRWNDDADAFVLTFFDPGREERARGTLTLTGQPTAGQTFVINTTTITAKASGAGADEFNIGSTVAETCTNIAAAVTAGTESGNIIGWGVDQTAVFQWQTPGTAGNAIVFTEAMSNTTADGGGTLGGTIAGRDLTPDRSFGPGQYKFAYGVGQDLTMVRNKVAITYGRTQDDRTTVLLQDAASQSAYGVRFMQIALDGASQIDTESEARRMGDGFLDDLKEPAANHTVTVNYFWPVEVGDYYTMQANGELFDTDQNVAVRSWRHVLSEKKMATTFTCSGKVSGGRKRWFKYEAQKAAPGVDQYTDDAPETPTATAGVGLIIYEYDDPRGMSPPINDWALTKVYASESSGFTPSDSTLRYTGRSTRVEIGGLTPGETYYVKAQFLDSSGNVSATSTQVSEATQKVGAYHLNEDSTIVNMIPNGQFGHATIGTASEPPDRWTADGWGVDITEETSTIETSTRALRFSEDGTGPLQLTTDYIPVSAETLYKIAIRMQTASGLSNLRLDGLYFDKNKAFVSSFSTSLVAVTSVGVWGTFEHFHIYGDGSGSTTAFMRWILKTNSANVGDVILDAATMLEAKQTFSSYRSTTVSLAAVSWTPIAHDTEVYDYGGVTLGGTVYGFNPANGRYTCLQPGKYCFSWNFGVSAVPSGAQIGSAIYLNGAGYKYGNYPQNNGAASNLYTNGTAEVEMVKGDYVDVRGFNSHSSSVTTFSGSAGMFFIGSRSE
jgi:hypothetical protein